MTKKEEVKALWKLCFEDTDEFVDLYFEKRYRDEINVDVAHDGKIVSSLQMIPYPMTFCGTTIDVSYISGACTHPDYRKRGLMKQLLADAHRKMYENNVWLSMLIPAQKGLFDYYARSGYAPSFGYAKQRILVDGLNASPLYTLSDETERQASVCEHYRYLSARMKECPCCVQHLKDDFRIIMKDLQLNEGKLLVARRAGLIHGMAFCVKEEGELVVKELLADNIAIRESLLKKAAETFGVEELFCLVPSSSNSIYLGMARVIHAERLLSLMARKYPDIELFVRLKGDEVIPENNGYYALCKGTCVRECLPDKNYQEYSVNDFTRLLLTAEHPFMSLMLN